MITPKPKPQIVFSDYASEKRKLAKIHIIVYN